jgi:hypothetical protein
MSYEVGSLQKVTIDGTSYTVAEDADAAVGKPKFTKEVIRGSNRNFVKFVGQDTSITGVPLLVTGAELLQLKALAEKKSSYPLMLMTCAGDSFRSDGHISYESYSTAGGRVEVTLTPDDDWKAFAL